MGVVVNDTNDLKQSSVEPSQLGPSPYLKSVTLSSLDLAIHDFP
jgi:hypothetical protein